MPTEPPTLPYAPIKPELPDVACRAAIAGVVPLLILPCRAVSLG
jgi:hypothetical protein